MRVADAVLSSMDLRAKAPFVAFLVMIVLRSALVSERQRPRPRYHSLGSYLRIWSAMGISVFGVDMDPLNTV